MAPKELRICVFGLWHLGSVTAACCAENHTVVGLDFNLDYIEKLKKGKAPIKEPGLDELLQRGIKRLNLTFTNDTNKAVKNADLIWVTEDTPVGKKNKPKSEKTLKRIASVLSKANRGTIVLISSQLPVGTIRLLEKQYPNLEFAVMPENLQLGDAINRFKHADRIVLGTRSNAARNLLINLLEEFSEDILHMTPESAELTKHALNGFLALSIAYANEVSHIARKVGANPDDIGRALKADERIGRKAYLMPGAPYAGQTLGRDVHLLGNMASSNEPILKNLAASNKAHKKEFFRRIINEIKEKVGDLKNREILIAGLTYKSNTSTLNGSLGLELATKLKCLGAKIALYEPNIKGINEINGMQLIKLEKKSRYNTIVIFRPELEITATNKIIAY